MPEVMRPSADQANQGIFVPFSSPQEIIPKEGKWPPQMATVTELPLPSISPELPKPQIQEAIIFTNPLQVKVREEWIPVREGVPASDIYTVLSEKSAKIRAQLSSLMPFEIEGQMEPDIKKEIVKQIAYTAAGTVDLLTDYGKDVDQLLLDKMETMEIKYPVRSVRELRVHGSIEKPGRMSAKEAMAYLKSHYREDGDTKIQNYQFRNLPIPESELELSSVDVDELKGKYQDADQRAIAKWQIEAFGSNLSAEGTVMPNMIGENIELMQEFEGLSTAQINKPDIDKLDAIAGEGIDYLIGLFGLMAVWDVDFKPEYDSAVERMKEKYRAVQKLSRRHNLSPVVVFSAIRDETRRAKQGMKQSFVAASLNLIR